MLSELLIMIICSLQQSYILYTIFVFSIVLNIRMSSIYQSDSQQTYSVCPSISNDDQSASHNSSSQLTNSQTASQSREKRATRSSLRLRNNHNHNNGLSSVSFQSKISTHSIAQITKLQLLNYQDVDQQQFQIIKDYGNTKRDNNQQGEQSQSELVSYLNWHMTEVPIGPNYQAEIPKIKSAQSYLSNNISKIVGLKYRKIHSPRSGELFFNEHMASIQVKVNPTRPFSYMDVDQIRNHFYKNSSCEDFIEYLDQDDIIQYWRQHFQTKDANLNKLKRGKIRKSKKRRYR